MLDDLVVFAYRDHVDGLRCRETSWLLSRRAEVVAEQRRCGPRSSPSCGSSTSGAHWMPARPRLACPAGSNGTPSKPLAVSSRCRRSRRLAAEGRLADEHWWRSRSWPTRRRIRSGPGGRPTARPSSCSRLVREQRTPTAEESMARHRARSLRLSWNAEKTVLHVQRVPPRPVGSEGRSDDQRDGRTVASPPRVTIGSLGIAVLRMRSARRAAMSTAAPPMTPVPSLAAKPVLVVEVRQHGPSVVGGVALPDEVVEQLRASATLEPVLVDDHGVPIAIGRRTRGPLAEDNSFGAPARWIVSVRLRGCVTASRSTTWCPSSWGGTDHFSDLAALFPSLTTTRLYIPHGPYALVGNPNVPVVSAPSSMPTSRAEEARATACRHPEPRRRMVTISVTSPDAPPEREQSTDS